MENKEPLHPLLVWENSTDLVTSFKALFVLCAHVLFRPVDFFREATNLAGVDLKKRIRFAILFIFILGYLKLFLDILNIYWLRHLPREMFPVSLEAQFSVLSIAVLSSPFFLLRPIVVFVLTFVLLSVSIKLMLGFDKPAMPIFLIVCYKGAADIFYGIPLVGGLLAVVWSMALLMVGVREGYGISLGRSVMTAIVMPFMLIFFLLLAAAPSLSRIFVSLYPEAQSQVIKLNDLNAYRDISLVVIATQLYKQELGFYPAHSGVLKKYLSSDVADVVMNPTGERGYQYHYQRLDDGHFTMEARPIKPHLSGRFVFYADERGEIRLNGYDGLLLENIQQMEDLIRKQKELA